MNSNIICVQIEKLGASTLITKKINPLVLFLLQLSDLSSAPIPLPDEGERRGSGGQDDSCCPKSLRLATPTRWRSKRVKFAYFLARARIVSKGLMVRLEMCQWVHFFVILAIKQIL